MTIVSFAAAVKPKMNCNPLDCREPNSANAAGAKATVSF